MGPLSFRGLGIVTGLLSRMTGLEPPGPKDNVAMFGRTRWKHKFKKCKGDCVRAVRGEACSCRLGRACSGVECGVLAALCRGVCAAPESGVRHSPDLPQQSPERPSP